MTKKPAMALSVLDANIGTVVATDTLGERFVTRTAPFETREEPNDDPMELATRAVDEMRTAFTTSLDEMRTQITDLETRMNRPGGVGAIQTTGEVTLERRAFTNFLRRGREAMEAEEVRALVVGDDTKGGYLAPAEFQAEVIKGIVELSPIRQAVRVGSTGAGSVILPKRTGRPTASWVGEDEEREETTMSYGQLEIPVHEIACYIDVSQRLLEDSAINVESEVATDLSEEFAVKEASAFSNGNGVKKPLGLQNASGIAEIINGNAANVSGDKLIALMYAMPAQYRNNGSWLMNGTTLGVIRTMKDGNGNYLWQPSYQAGQPSTLLGRPVIEDPTMPDIAANAFPLMYGDFSKAYRIYDRVGMSILRDPFTQATKGLVRFHARRRVGGGPVLTEALRKLKMAASS
ncbi:phage major capsid protein [Agrobacterium vitis]|uniref:Phage major capsid protein n=1 Tax=Agrobacterium vitis TaxID=373 RepID=A0AAE4WF84_AGRVI|nr:phage major capsid protein [Agrobacterium vitis]MCF1499629.1 phage major capsid protein [Allorhizobium sp. Av2]MCM2440697.1 phage major capsid protein [Agrobacterium vitis]MUZ59324.1 phage major capsid protein [Agrobacterium vitis]MVA66555.1 phage major capsid protein [Agrobacterium vitis]MVA87416.1 phage major capsid protein [Agrobacterium vitis]